MPPPDKNTSVFLHGHIDRSTWKRVRLGDVCSIKARIGWQGLKKSEHLDFGNYCLVSGTDFYNGFVNWKTCSYVSEWRYAQDTNIQLTNGDVLITKDGTIGKIAYVQGMAHPTTLNSGVFVIRPISNELHPAFLQLVFKSRFFTDFLDKITAGSTIVHLYQKDIIDFEFPIPDIDTQLLIEKSISAIDECIKDQKSCIAKYEAIKKSTVNLLLEPKADWRTSTMGESFDLSRGVVISKNEIERRPGIYPVYSSQSVNDGVLGLIDSYRYDGEYITWTTDGANAGTVFYRHGKFNCTNVCGIAKARIPKMSPAFVALMIAQYAKSYVSYVGNPKLMSNIFAQILFSYPSASEQRKIAEKITAIDKVLADYKAQLEKARQLKAGMMSSFFG